LPWLAFPYGRGGFDLVPALTAGVAAIAVRGAFGTIAIVNAPRARALARGRYCRLAFCLSMILSENRFPPRIKSGQAFSGSCASGFCWK
jgi:hypothetical protein